MSPRRLWNSSGGVGTSVGMASLLIGDPKRGETATDLMPSGFQDETVEGSETTMGGTTVLAAAAKIERGLKKSALS